MTKDFRGGQQAGGFRGGRGGFDRGGRGGFDRGGRGGRGGFGGRPFMGPSGIMIGRNDD